MRHRTASVNRSRVTRGKSGDERSVFMRKERRQRIRCHVLNARTIPPFSTSRSRGVRLFGLSTRSLLPRSFPSVRRRRRPPGCSLVRRQSSSRPSVRRSRSCCPPGESPDIYSRPSRSALSTGGQRNENSCRVRSDSASFVPSFVHRDRRGRLHLEAVTPARASAELRRLRIRAPAGHALNRLPARLAVPPKLVPHQRRLAGSQGGFDGRGLRPFASHPRTRQFTGPTVANNGLIGPCDNNVM